MGVIDLHSRSRRKFVGETVMDTVNVQLLRFIPPTPAGVSAAGRGFKGRESSHLLSAALHGWEERERYF